MLPDEKTMKTLIINGTILTLNDKHQTFKPGYILLEDDKIIVVGEGTPPEELITQVKDVINAENMAVIPGIVNAHTHLFQTFIRGLADDKPLWKWLETAIWPVGTNMSLSEARLSALLGYVENIRSGVTSVIDNQYLHNNDAMDDVYCQAAEETGVRLLMTRGWADINYNPAFMESPEKIIEQVGQLVSRWNRSATGRIRVWFGPLGSTGCSEGTMKRTLEAAREWGIGFHMHIAEAKDLTDAFIHEKGLGEVEWLDKIGCLDEKMHLVHAIWLSDHELDLIAARGAKVIHCPVSNMYLADGVARIPEMRRRGITIALGTDGPGSNNNQDMIETLKTTALLHKITSLDPMIILPEDILWMACRGGAEAFGQPEQIGSLEPGKKADLAIIDLNSPFAAPVHREASALVYSLHGCNVDTVIVDGKVVMRNKQITILDEEALLMECRRASVDLLSRAKISV